VRTEFGQCQFCCKVDVDTVLETYVMSEKVMKAIFQHYVCTVYGCREC
jgi:hypothetical protein